jgi:hypothetical protein
MARKKTSRIAIVALAATMMLMVAASSSSATVYRSLSFNLTGHDEKWDQTTWGPSIPNDYFPCYASLTANSGSVQSHRVGIYNVTDSGRMLYSAWTTASVATTPWIGCMTAQNTATGQYFINWMHAQQSTSSGITRNYTMRGIG